MLKYCTLICAIYLQLNFFSFLLDEAISIKLLEDNYLIRNEILNDVTAILTHLWSHTYQVPTILPSIGEFNGLVSILDICDFQCRHTCLVEGKYYHKIFCLTFGTAFLRVYVKVLSKLE